MTQFNKLIRKGHHLLKVVTSEGYLIWSITHPFYIFLYLFNKFMSLFIWICVIISEKTHSIYSLCSLKVYSYRLDMTYM